MKSSKIKRIALQPLGDHVIINLKALEAASALYNLEAVNIMEAIPVPSDAYNSVRRQYDGERILSIFAKSGHSKYDYRLFVTNSDIYSYKSKYVFGVADPKSKMALVSAFRLSADDSSKNTERVLKEAAHEIGHLVGLGHCPNDTCIMSYATDVFAVDKKYPMLCADCIAILNKAV